MADFSALKTSIQNYIKQNGNEEITGNLLQQILLSMVTTLGDSAINDLVNALNAEIANRGNADTELRGSITTLQGVVNGIKTNVENGYVYAGIATPSTTPASGKVFYLALTAGTYTNFGATEVPQGINILKYNGSAWSLDSFIELDDAPTQGSNNLVKSGGVLDSIIKDGSAFDLSAYNNGTTYADLSAALTALNALPAAYKKGGMSMKFVQTSDNKYVQYRLMADDWSTTVTYWQGVDDEPTAESNNLVKSGGVWDFVKGTKDELLVNNTGVNIHTDSYTPLAGTYQGNTLLRIDGTLEVGEGLNAFAISTYNISKGRSYILRFKNHGVNAYFSNATIYKNGEVVKVLKPGDGITNEFSFAFDTAVWDVDTLIIGIQAGTFGSTSVLESEHITGVKNVDENQLLTNNKIYALTGKVIIPEPTSIITGGIYSSDGSIDQSMGTTNGQISSYSIPKDRVLRVHLIRPIMNEEFAVAALYKNGDFVKTIYTCDFTLTETDFLYDTKGLDVDEIKICSDTEHIGETVFSYGCENINPYQLESNQVSALSLVDLPPKIYTLTVNRTGFNVLTRLYIEGLAKVANQSLKINGESSIFASYDWNNNEGTFNKEVYFTAEGYDKAYTNISIEKTSPTRVQNQLPKIMLIGDSLTDEGYPALTEFIFKSLNQDYGNIKTLMVGTLVENLSLTLGNYTYNCKGANEGRSGWAVSDFLRKIMVVRRNGENLSYIMTGKTAWDFMGLGTMSRNGIPERAYTPYEDTDACGELMRATCHGWYDADPTEDLWNYITQTLGITSFTYNGQSYSFGSSYSSADDATQIAAVKYICETQSGNPFYDYATVQSSNGSYAFNLNSYLNKYKTLDSDGETRLVVGSTAGSKITSQTINVYDVCTPTHCVIILGENDWNLIGQHGNVIANDLILMANLISSYSNSIKIAIGSTRGYGAINPDSYNFIGTLRYFIPSTRHLEINSKLKELISTTNYTHLPIYATQNPNGSWGGKGFDTLDAKERECYAGDGVHAAGTPGNNTLLYLDRAYQVAAWVISTYMN